MAKRVIALYRNSTFNQNARLIDSEQDKYDIPLQSRECQKFVSLHPEWLLIDERTETGVSGYKVSANDRDEITKLKDEAIQNKFDILLVFAFDRIGRIDDETPFLVEWFVKHGVEVWSVVEGQQRFDTHVDKLMNYIRFWQASGESAKTAIRVRTKLGQMVQDGLYKGGFIPFGYRIVKKGTINHKNREVYDLEIEPNEAEIVKRIFYLAVEKFWGAQKISTALASEGIINKKGKPFSQPTINKILDNISYTGVLKSGDTIPEIHEHLQIIEPTIFEKAKELRQKRRKDDMKLKESPKYRDTENSMSCNDVSSAPTGGRGLLSGIIRCSGCNSKLRTKSKTKNKSKPYSADNPRIPIYVCNNRLYEGRQAGLCKGDDVQTQYIAEKIDTAVDDMIKDILTRTKQLQDGTFINYKYQLEWQRIHGKLNTARTAYNKKKNEISAMENKIVGVAQSDEDMSLLLPILKRLKSEAETLLEQVQICEKEVAEFQKNCSEIEREYNKIIQWADIYNSADIETKKIIAAHLIESVSVKKGYELDITFKISIEQFESGLDFQEMSS